MGPLEAIGHALHAISGGQRRGDYWGDPLTSGAGIIATEARGAWRRVSPACRRRVRKVAHE